MIPQSEYEDLRKSSESRISLLEEEIADMKDDLQQRNSNSNSKMVTAEKYEELKENNRRESRIMQDQLAMLAEEMASTTEKVGEGYQILYLSLRRKLVHSCKK